MTISQTPGDIIMSVLIVEDNLIISLSSNLSKGKRSFKPYQNEYDARVRYLSNERITSLTVFVDKIIFLHIIHTVLV